MTIMEKLANSMNTTVGTLKKKQTMRIEVEYLDGKGFTETSVLARYVFLNNDVIDLAQVVAFKMSPVFETQDKTVHMEMCPTCGAKTLLTK